MENQKHPLVKFIDKETKTWLVDPASVSSIMSIGKDQLTWRITLKETTEDGYNRHFTTDISYSELIRYFPQMLV